MILVGVIVVIMAAATIAFFAQAPGLSTKPIASTDKTVVAEPFFDDSSTIMYFWQPGCSYCQKQAPILREIAADKGLKVKSMNVEDQPALWQQYQLTGTPTFVDAYGKRLVGLQKDKDTLIQFMKEGNNAR